MARYFLLNTVYVGSTVYPAGSAVDDVADPVAALREVGAVLLSTAHAAPQLVAAVGRSLQARTKGANFPVLDQVVQSSLLGDFLRLGGGSTFTYREGVTDPPPNVFDTFDEARWNAARARPGYVWVDASLGQPVVPAGEFDVDQVGLLGGFGLSANLVLQNGARFTGSALYFNNVVLNHAGQTPVFQVGDGKQLTVTFDNGAAMNAIPPSGSPLFSVAENGALLLYLRYFGFMFSHGPGAPVVEAALNGQVSISADLATAIFDNSLAGAGSYVVGDVPGIAVDNRNLNLSHTQLAADIAYTYG